MCVETLTLFLFFSFSLSLFFSFFSCPSHFLTFSLIPSQSSSWSNHFDSTLPSLHYDFSSRYPPFFLSFFPFSFSFWSCFVGQSFLDVWGQTWLSWRGVDVAVSATLGLSIAIARFVSSHPYLGIILSTCLFLSVSLSGPLQWRQALRNALHIFHMTKNVFLVYGNNRYVMARNGFSWWTHYLLFSVPYDMQGWAI